MHVLSGAAAIVVYVMWISFQTPHKRNCSSAWTHSYNELDFASSPTVGNQISWKTSFEKLDFMKYDIWHADMSKIIDGEAYGSVIPSCMLCVRILRIYPQASRTMNIATATSDFLEKSRFVPAISIIQAWVEPQQKGRGAALDSPSWWMHEPYFSIPDNMLFSVPMLLYFIFPTLLGKSQIKCLPLGHIA